MGRRTLLSSRASILHVAAGAATAYLASPWLAAAYAAYPYVAGDPSDNCPNSVVQGAEYAIGYFGVLLFLQTYAGLSY